MKGLYPLENWGEDQRTSKHWSPEWERIFEEPSEPEVVGVLQTQTCPACSEVGYGDGKCQTVQTELPVLLLS